MDIRPYQASDLPTVAGLFTAAVHELAAQHYDAAQREAWAPRPPNLGEWQLRLANLQVLIAEDAQGLRGFIGYENDGHIDLLFTSPRQPRSGVASRLYAEAERRLRGSGATLLFTEASLVARPFFERQGFVVVEEQQVSRRGQVFIRFAMNKQLAR